MFSIFDNAIYKHAEAMEPHLNLSNGCMSIDERTTKDGQNRTRLSRDMTPQSRAIFFWIYSGNELELELIQSHMAQKPMLRGEVGCARVAREVSVERGDSHLNTFQGFSFR